MIEANVVAHSESEAAWARTLGLTVVVELANLLECFAVSIMACAYKEFLKLLD